MSKTEPTLRERVESQKVRVSMNVKHLTVQSGDSTLIQLEDGRWREMPIRDITFHREGEFGESPWTRFYDLNDPTDREDVEALQALIEKNPGLATDARFRVRIVGEFEGSGEPWPGYDDQSADQVVAYYNAMPSHIRPTLETMLQYELGNDVPDEAKIVAIETLDKNTATAEKNAASAGAKL